MPSIDRAHHTANSEEPVFIVGPARSGTSILYRALQASERFMPKHSQLGFELSESKSFSLPCDLLQPVEAPPPEPLAFMLHDEARFHDFRRSLDLLEITLPEESWQRHIAGLSENARVREWTERGLTDVLRSFYNHAKIARGVDRMLDKTPEFLHRTPEILATFPNAKILCICRHPVDVMSSYRRRLAKEIEAHGSASEDFAWLERPLDELTELYGQELSLALDTAERTPEHFLLIRYEEFTEQTETTLSGIWDFLGESGPLPVIMDVRDRVTWDIDPLLYAPVTPKTKDWRDYLSAEEAKRVEARLQDILARAGYLASRLD